MFPMIGNDAASSPASRATPQDNRQVDPTDNHIAGHIDAAAMQAVVDSLGEHLGGWLVIDKLPGYPRIESNAAMTAAQQDITRLRFHPIVGQLWCKLSIYVSRNGQPLSVDDIDLPDDNLLLFRAAATVVSVVHQWGATRAANDDETDQLRRAVAAKLAKLDNAVDNRDGTGRPVPDAPPTPAAGTLQYSLFVKCLARNSLVLQHEWRRPDEQNNNTPTSEHKSGQHDQPALITKRRLAIAPIAPDAPSTSSAAVPALTLTQAIHCYYPPSRNQHMFHAIGATPHNSPVTSRAMHEAPPAAPDIIDATLDALSAHLDSPLVIGGMPGIERPRRRQEDAPTNLTHLIFYRKHEETVPRLMIGLIRNGEKLEIMNVKLPNYNDILFRAVATAELAARDWNPEIQAASDLQTFVLRRTIGLKVHAGMSRPAASAHAEHLAQAIEIEPMRTDLTDFPAASGWPLLEADADADAEQPQIIHGPIFGILDGNRSAARGIKRPFPW